MPSKPARGAAGDGKFMKSCRLAIIGRPGNKSRDETKRLLEEAGGKVVDQVSKATHILLAAKPTVTPDIETAKAKGIPMVTYHWFKASLDNKRMQDVSGYTVLGSNQPTASSSKGDSKASTPSSSSIPTSKAMSTSTSSKANQKASSSSNVDKFATVTQTAPGAAATLATKKSDGSTTSSSKKSASAPSFTASTSAASPPKKSTPAPPSAKKTDRGSSKRDAVVISDDDNDTTTKQTAKKARTGPSATSTVIDLTMDTGASASSRSSNVATTAGGSRTSTTKRSGFILLDEAHSNNPPLSPASTIIDDDPMPPLAADPLPIPRPKVDPESGLKATHRVVENRGDFFIATLNLAEIAGPNTFYILQALEPKSGGGKYIFFTRRGRIGHTGKIVKSSYKDAQGVIDAFEAKFKEKSGLSWRERYAQPVKGKYTLLIGMTEFEDEDEDGEGGSAEVAETRLPQPVYELGKMVFDENLFEATLKQMGYDSKKTPLGKLSPLAIERGYEALSALSAAIAAGTVEAEILDELISEYYTNIPHAVDRGEQLPRIADSAAVEKERQLCDSLRDVSIGMSLMQNKYGEMKQRINPIDASIKRLNLKTIMALDKSTAEYKTLERAALEGQGWSHGLDFDIVEIYRIERYCEDDRFAKWKELTPDNRQLLWHGSRLANFGGILSEGLRIAPSTAPMNGYMFGKGVYFADVTTKSINYCYKSRQGSDGLLLLCEVQLGDEIQMTYSDSQAAEKVKAQNKHSIFGRGMTCHTAAQWVDAGQTLGRDELKGVKMPLGKPQQGAAGYPSSGLLYNEHIVYDEGQIRFRYLFRLKLKGNGY